MSDDSVENMSWKIMLYFFETQNGEHTVDII